MTVSTNERRVAVLGSGAWGTALAQSLASTGVSVNLWSRSEAHTQALHAERMNARYLPGVSLHAGITPTHDLAESMQGVEAVVLVAPSHGTRAMLLQLAPVLPAHVPLVSATKGIENDSLMFIDELVRDVLGDEVRARFAVLSGPSFAAELARELPTAVAIASENPELCTRIQKLFRAPHLRTYASDDVAGVECGAALKNVIAIAAGAADGAGFGHNTRAALITRGLNEIARMAVARGGKRITLAGLAGMGDLILTCTGDLSRNRTVGFELGKGRKLHDILASLGHVAEGVKTTKSAYDLALKLNVDMPITTETYRVLYEDKPVQEAVRHLMARELGREF